MSLGSLDVNEIGRFEETTPIGLTFSGYLNLIMENISARLTKLRPRYCELTVTTASAPNSTTSTLGTAGALAYVEASDPDGWHNPAVNPTRITPTVAGRYLIMAEVEWASNGTGLRILQIGRNNVFTNRVRAIVLAADDAVGSLQLATEVALNGTTDYVTVTVFQNAGGALNVTARVVARYLGPA